VLSQTQGRPLAILAQVHAGPGDVAQQAVERGEEILSVGVRENTTVLVWMRHARSFRVKGSIVPSVWSPKNDRKPLSHRDFFQKG
jgi:hypothetical protein